MSRSAFEAQILAIALKTAEGGPMCEVPDAVAEADGGLVGSLRPAPDRGLTFLAVRQWQQVLSELSAELPWHTRRANILLDADSLAHLIGRTVRIGAVSVRILDETRPCKLMDAQHKGLTRALAPACRGGVLGRVLSGGPIRVGDRLRLVD